LKAKKKGHNFNCRSAQQQRHLAKQVQTVDANHFFNLLTDARMLGTVEAQTRTPYDEATYLNALQRRGSPLI